MARLMATASVRRFALDADRKINSGRAIRWQARPTKSEADLSPMLDDVARVQHRLMRARLLK